MREVNLICGRFLFIVLLFLLNSAHADNTLGGNILRLSCDTKLNTQNHDPSHVDLEVDFKNNTVSGYRASISDSTIYFEAPQSNGDIISTVISRNSGSFSANSKSLGLMATGDCVKVEHNKF